MARLAKGITVEQAFGCAFDIEPRADGKGRTHHFVGRIFVRSGNVAHRAAIGHDHAFETPILTQRILHQEGVGAGRLAIDRAVGAHHRTGMTIDHGGAKRGKISVAHIV